nr:ninein [Leptinotarsa decemlineata]
MKINVAMTMEQFALDPYEQQLLKVFDSHDKENCGSLDREGLVQLCQTLQLEEQGIELVKCLLKNRNSRATFSEFKDALLALLGNMQSSKNSKNEETVDNCTKTSPEREVSPKFVYGSKKYGRRSRPRNDEVTSIYNEQNDISLNKSQNIVSVQRSNSQSEVSSKKRKTNYKLKRCTSLPGSNDVLISNTTDNNCHMLSSELELVCTEEMLREAWRKLGVGEDGYLNRTELILVCDAIGLHKLADGVIRQLSHKLNINCNHKISFQELLTTLQQDETWFEVLNQSPLNSNDPVIHQSNSTSFPDSRTFHFITLGPDGNGIIKTDVLIEMWESIGVHSPKELLQELGFNCRQIKIVELAEVLEKQMKSIHEATRTAFQNPHITLLQANLTLYQSEIKTLKSILEQIQAEREKLKCDVSEANNRATLLAQEVDDNHLRMEQNTLNQVKLLEQRHSDILREVTTQFSRDKEQLSNINQGLESKIISLEQEVTKIKNDLLVAQKYSLNMEKENHFLSGKIVELEKDKSVLNNQIEILENEKQEHSEMEQEESKLLLAKLSVLQLENSQLKDRNDEMVSEIESLSNQMATMRMKVSSTPTLSMNPLDQSMEENISVICEGVGVGAKRRSDYSPSKDSKLFNITDGSPRLGKIRKFYNIKQDNLDVPFASSESGFDTEVDCFDSSSSLSTDDNKEITRLQAKIAFLEQILIQNKIPLPVVEAEDPELLSGADLCHLVVRVKQLEKIIEIVRKDMKMMIEKGTMNSDSLRKVSVKLEQTFLSGNVNEGSYDLEEKKKKGVDVGAQTDFLELFEDKVTKLESENRELCTKCSELENCVELLRNEYEKCEDYWQSKVDEERQMFEAEQKINSDKLSELFLKMKDYEEQYANQELVDNRLPTIEETYNLEKQFTDLEQEFELYKEHSESELLRKDEQIEILKEKLTQLALRQQDLNEAAVQVNIETEESRLLNKMKNLSGYVIESSNFFPEEIIPPTTQSTPKSPPPNNLEYVNQSLIWNQQPNPPENTESSQSLPVNWNFTNDTKIQSNASTSSSSTCLDNSTPCAPCRPKRTRKYDKNLYKKNNQDKDVKDIEIDKRPQMDSKNFQNSNCNPEQSIILPLRSFQNLNTRRNHLEQRVRHLQICLKQQHFRNEQTLHHYWAQFKGERSDLHSKLKYFQDKLEQQVRISKEQLDKLESTDLLVKDLFVENSYLLATVQRLELQCTMLTSLCNSSSV